MRKKIKKKIFNLFFKEFGDKKPVGPNYSDFTKFDLDVIELTSEYTLTNPERIVSLIKATEYVVKNDIPGSIVECGVWKGGSVMAILHTLNNLSVSDRNVYLYDTFEGMSEPTELDKTYRGESASKAFKKKNEVWDKIECYSSIEEVKKNLFSVGYNEEKIQFKKGKVEDTISKDNLPNEISLLRLDTDWYESTKHELEFLFPKLVKGGVLIIDDYGHWEGCKRAVDEYFKEKNIKIFLNRVDYTCRLGIKN
jgi:O-methyltransferase